MDNYCIKVKTMEQEIEAKRKIKKKLWDEACKKDVKLSKEIEELEDALYDFKINNYMFSRKDI